MERCRRGRTRRSCQGPCPPLHPALELHEGADSRGTGGREGKARFGLSPSADSAVPSWQTTKAKYKIPTYPYLLPKSTSTANHLPFTIPGGQCTTVQVTVLISQPLPSLSLARSTPPREPTPTPHRAQFLLSWSYKPHSIHHAIGLEVCGPMVSGDFGELYPQCLPTYHQREPALSVH